MSLPVDPPRTIESYIPTKLSKEQVEQFRKMKDCSIQHARVVCRQLYKESVRDALKEATSDYLMEPERFGTTFLADIINEMLEII